VSTKQYELVAVLWDEPTSKPGEPFVFKRHRQGDLVELSEDDAARLLAAGAVVEPGAVERAQVEALRLQYEAALAALPAKPDEEPAPDPVQEGAVVKPLTEMGLADLRDYAKAKEIDLTGVDQRKVDEVREAIAKAEAA